MKPTPTWLVIPLMGALALAVCGTLVNRLAAKGIEAVTP
jgi:hypothetical protein